MRKPSTATSTCYIHEKEERDKYGGVHYATITDEYVKLGTIRPEAKNKAKQPKRGIITDISPGARLRALKQIALIDWSKHKTGSFVTLTFPDDHASDSYKRMTQYRSAIMRDLESAEGCMLPTLWRKEYKARLTGRYTGVRVPHFHIACMKELLVDEEWIRSAWMRIIGARVYTQVDKREMEDGEHAARYVCKYLQKKDQQGILDKLAYLNNTGRAWGWTRKNLLTQKDTQTITHIPDDEFERLQQLAEDMMGRERMYKSNGQTVFGFKATEICKKIDEMIVDKGMPLR